VTRSATGGAITQDRPADDGPAPTSTGAAPRRAGVPDGGRLGALLRAGGARLRAVDPLVVAVGVLALVTSTGFVLVNAAYNVGRPVPPLDDVYIHLQYARQIGVGDFLRYQPGDPPTTGASSLLYVLLLGAIAALGVQGLLLYVAIALGAACFVGTVVLVHLLGRALASRTAGAVAAVLTALCGPLLWGATSGIEVGLVSLLVAGTLLAFVSEQAEARFVLTPLVGTLLAMARPEGMILVVAVLCGVAVVLVDRARRGIGRRSRLAATAAWSALPLVAGAVQLLVYRALTGTAENSGIQAKSWLSESLGSPLEVVDRMVSTVRAALLLLGGLDGIDVVGPGVAVLVAIGLASLALGRAPRRVLAGVLVLGGTGILVAVSTLTTALWHNGRYLQPFLPVVLLLTVLGIRALAGMVGDPRSGRVLSSGLVALLVVIGLIVAPTWALRGGQQAAGIRESSVSVAAWLRGNTPPDARIAVNDVGAVAYLSDRQVIDLVGLTTNGLARPAIEGSGALYEALVAMPADRRPTHFSIFSDWGMVPVGDLVTAKILGDEPLTSFQAKNPARDGGPFGGICQSTGDCRLLDVWAADWSHVGGGDLPDAAVPGRIVDHVNVGSLSDEAAHAYAVDPALVGVGSKTLLGNVTTPDGRIVVDSGRHVVGGETFTLSGLEPGRPVVLTARNDAKEPVAERNTQAGVVGVDAGGRRVGGWTFATADGGWAQSSTVIPAEFVTASTLTLTVGPVRPYLAPFPDYRSYGYWASQ